MRVFSDKYIYLELVTINCINKGTWTTSSTLNDITYEIHSELSIDNMIYFYIIYWELGLISGSGMLNAKSANL